MKGQLRVLLLVVALIQLAYASRDLQDAVSEQQDASVAKAGRKGSYYKPHKHYHHSPNPEQPPTCNSGPYPTGNCLQTSECLPNQAFNKCFSDGSNPYIPVNTTCGSVTPICHQKNFTDNYYLQGWGYCMPKWESACDDSANLGCASRCSLYVATQFHCTRDALNNDGSLNPQCTYCNYCFDHSRDSSPDAAVQAPYYMLLGRDEYGSLFQNHWLVIPKAACAGIESTSRLCTGPEGEYIWSNALREANSRGFTYRSGSTPDWAIMLNAPNRRGVHQMHIHIAHLDDGTRNASYPPAWGGPIPVANYLLHRAAAAGDISKDPCHPTKIVGGGFVPYTRSGGEPDYFPPSQDYATMFAVFVPTSNPVGDLGSKIKPFALGKQLYANSDLPQSLGVPASYGLTMMPRTVRGETGLLIGIHWSTSDYEQLDQEGRDGDTIKYARACFQYKDVPLAFPPFP